MIRAHHLSCGYQGYSFDIKVARYISGMQAFEKIGTLRGDRPRAALRCSLFAYPSILPRQFSVSPELWEQFIVLKFFLAESAL